MEQDKGHATTGGRASASLCRMRAWYRRGSQAWQGKFPVARPPCGKDPSTRMTHPMFGGKKGARALALQWTWAPKHSMARLSAFICHPLESSQGMKSHETNGALHAKGGNSQSPYKQATTVVLICSMKLLVYHRLEGFISKVKNSNGRIAFLQ